MNQSKEPQLRFKKGCRNEFSTWKTTPIGKVTTKRKGNTLSKEDLTADGRFPCILYGQLYTTYGPIAKNIISRTNVFSDGMIFSEKDDVVVPISGETALDISTASCIKEENVAIGGDLLVLKSPVILGEFLSYSLNYPLRSTIAKYAQGASIVHMNVDSLMKVKIHFPCMDEQKKIVSFFSVLDRCISLADRKLAALQTIKKGMLQKIFSQELRFKDDDGKEFPAWKSITLEDISEYVTSSGIDSPYIGTENLQKNYSGVIFENSKKRFGNKFQQGDILIGNIRPYLKKIWLSICNGCASLDVLIIRPKKTINSKFIFCQLAQDTFFDYVMQGSKGTKMPRGDKKHIMKFSISLPTLPEQQKIATFFTSLDCAIANTQKKADALRTIKKGLLQKMFV